MARKMLPIDYVTKDYEGFKQMMIEAIPNLAPEWTDLSDSDFGIVLVQLLSWGLDILSMYQDKAVSESFLPTAQTRKAVIDICRTLTYELATQTPSKFDIVFKKLEDFKDKEVVIPRGTGLCTDPIKGQSIKFETDDDFIIPAGVLGDEKDENGKYLYSTLATQGIFVKDDLGVSNGKAFQKFKLNYDDVIVEHIKVWTVDNGLIRNWTRVGSFLESKSSDRHYIVRVNEFNEVRLEFGDGKAGLKPPRFCSVYSSYKIGGGTKGNVGINTINHFSSSEVVGVDTFTNPYEPVEYGEDTETIENARVQAPKLFSTNDRAVTASDFEIFACKINGVTKAYCEETFNENNDAVVYIASKNYVVTSDGFKETVKAELSKRQLINNNIIVKDVDYVPLDIELVVTTYPDYENDQVKTRVNDTIRKCFKADNLEIGQSLIKAQLSKELMIMDEVFDLCIKLPTTNVDVKKNQLLTLNKITITVEGGVH